MTIKASEITSATTFIALVTDQGTCADETVICRACDTVVNRSYVLGEARRDVFVLTGFHDVSDNDAVSCQICGRDAAPVQLAA